MGVFQLDLSPNLFLLAPDTNSLWVWELKVPHSSGVEAKNWVYKHSVGAAEWCDYSSIKLYETEIQGSVLQDLAQDLYFSHLIVNYQGYSYFDTALVGDLSFTPQYYRLNDLFSWSTYTKLHPHSISFTTSTTTINFNWDRCDFRNGNHVLVSLKHDQIMAADDKAVQIHDLVKQNKSLTDALRKAEHKISKKNEEIKKLREQLRQCQPKLVGDPAKVVKNRKRHVGDSRFEYSDFPLPYPQPSLSGGRLAREETLPVFTPVDENVPGMFPRDMLVYVEHEDGDFYTTGWSYIKAVNDVSGKESMIAFYEGKYDTVNVHGDIVGVPYKSGRTFSSSRKIFLANIQGIGKLFVFLYGEDEDEEDEDE